jgi:hypothetical protein
VRRLRGRVAGTGTVQSRAMAQTTPVQGSRPSGTAATPMTMPLSHVSYLPNEKYPWTGTAAYQDMVPLWTPDGALVPAWQGGSWGQLWPAGRASPAHQ